MGFLGFQMIFHAAFLARRVRAIACALLLLPGLGYAQTTPRTLDTPVGALANGERALASSADSASAVESEATRLESKGAALREPGKPAEAVDQEAKEADSSKRTADKTRAPNRKEPPSQFQRFVQEATGSLLPHFGSALFEAPQSYGADASLAAPVGYVLGPGDEVRLRVWGAVDFSANLLVDRNGQVQIPRVGVVTLAGVALSELETVLRGQIARTYTNFSLSANLGRLRSIQVYVVGQAKQPGTYVVSSLSTLVNALFVSGGPNINGSMRRIELQRAGKVVTRLDLYDFIARGDKSKDLALMPGDVIFIPPATQRVAVTGAFDQAAIYELGPNTTVAEVLSLGGGASPVASSRKAILERVDASQQPARQVQTLALDADGLKLLLRGGDILTLLPVSPAFANAVTLQGVVAEPLRYPWFEGMRIRDLIPSREALITPDYYRRKNQLVQQDRPQSAATANVDETVTNRFRSVVDQINWQYAVIERLNRDTLSIELLPFNLGKAVLQYDAAENRVLAPGDVVTIFNHQDLALPQERQSRLVRVEGEVAAPGIYTTLPGETLPQLIARIGGLSSNAYLFGVEFARESVRRQQQGNLDTFIRKLEAQLQGRAAGTIATGSDPTALAQAQNMQQQQQAQLKAQIDRLRALRSSGRIALELDPQSKALSALPAIVLEDGDRVVVPSVPSFVSALGAVSNESAIIYKPGKNIGDIIRAAGFQVDAEPASAFVLRADGSVLTKRDRAGWFGGSFESTPIMPGDTLVVPAKVDVESAYNFTIRALKDWTQIFANFGLGVVAAKQL
jgi:protein involved in polysaccharide export with SLBB domain